MIKKKLKMMVHKRLLRLFLLMIYVLIRISRSKIREKLYQFALDYAKELGCYNLTLHVWNDNADALRFYERLGMKPRYTEMETILK
ncbi:MAG: GNAT family N-acetyltransferase [Streptococcus sp.]